MAKPEISTEWTVCDSDAEWENIQTQPFLSTSETVQPARLGIRRSVIAALVLVVSITGVWLWRTAQMGLNEIDAELNAAVEGELWAVREGEGDLAADLATDSQESDLQLRIKRDHTLLKEAVAKADGGGGVPGTTPEMIADLEIVQLREDHAVVRVLVQIGDEAFRQMRIYRRRVDGWQLASPDRNTLGEWRQLQTEHLSIGYFELDEAMVKEAAPRLDAFFAQAIFDFGLAAAVQEGRVAIAITPGGGFADDDFMRDVSREMGLSTNAIQVNSPSFQLLPAATSDADMMGGALFQMAVYPLIFPMVQETLDQFGRPWGDERNWLSLLLALRLWEFWQSETVVAGWKDEIIELEMQGYGNPENVAAHYDDICRAYRLWNLSPTSMSIPLNCESSWRDPSPTGEMPDTLNGLLAPAPGVYCMPDWAACQESHEVGLATVLDYVVATYGREQLPLLVGALGEHQRWETLIPAVFGVSREEFERGWQAYLAEHYR